MKGMKLKKRGWTSSLLECAGNRYLFFWRSEFDLFDSVSDVLNIQGFEDHRILYCATGLCTKRHGCDLLKRISIRNHEKVILTSR